jgi:hypothetical protein
MPPVGAVEPKRPGCAEGAPKAGAGATAPKAEVPAVGAGCPKAGCVAPNGLLAPKADVPGAPAPKVDLLNMLSNFL